MTPSYILNPTTRNWEKGKLWTENQALKAKVAWLEFMLELAGRELAGVKLKRGRSPLGKKAMTGAERTRRHRAKIRKMFDHELGNVVKFKR